MNITSWNVNSLNVRLPHVLQYLQETAPDVLGRQEPKQTDAAIDRAALAAAGYHLESHGQKTYNGVALLAREALTDVVRGIPGYADEQARAIAANVGDVRVLNLYVPNGKAVGDEKYTYKLHWLDAVTATSTTSNANTPNSSSSATTTSPPLTLTYTTRTNGATKSSAPPPNGRRSPTSSRWASRTPTARCIRTANNSAGGTTAWAACAETLVCAST